MEGEQPWTLVLHGGPGAGRDYLEPLEALAAVFYDQLGCGRSDQPDDRSLWRMDRFVAEVGMVRRALGLERIHLEETETYVKVVAQFLAHGK